MKAIILIVPSSIKQRLDLDNAPKSAPFIEDYGRIFAVVPKETIDGHEIIILTHYFKGSGRRRSFAHVDGSDPKTMLEEQLIGNHLTECAKVTGFMSAGVAGLFHLHPDAPDTSYSADDCATFRRHALTTKSQFCIGPIGCRHGGKTYIKWFFYNALEDQVYIIPPSYIHVIDDLELEGQFPGIGGFLALEPTHILSNIDSISPATADRRVSPPLTSIPLRYPPEARPIASEISRTTSRNRLISVLASGVLMFTTGLVGVMVGRASINVPTPDRPLAINPAPVVAVFSPTSTGKVQRGGPTAAVLPPPVIISKVESASGKKNRHKKPAGLQTGKTPIKIAIANKSARNPKADKTALAGKPVVVPGFIPKTAHHASSPQTERPIPATLNGQKAPVLTGLPSQPVLPDAGLPPPTSGVTTDTATAVKKPFQETISTHLNVPKASPKPQEPTETAQGQILHKGGNEHVLETKKP